MGDKIKLLQERQERIEKTLRNKKPDRVPVCSLATSWAYYQIGKKPLDSFEDPELNKDVFRNLYKNFYWDGVILARNGKTFTKETLDLLGGGTYTYDKNGMQQTNPGSIGLMKDDEYDELISDPYRYIIEKIFPRRYEIMRRTDDNKYNDFVKIIDDVKEMMRRNAEEDKIAEEEFGIHYMRLASVFHPIDIILDYLRDFVPIASDVRRRPEKLRDAGLSLLDFQLDNLKGVSPVKGKVVFIPMHLPQFLRPSDFEKVYWPSYQKMVDFLVQNNYTPMFYFERKYEHLFDFFLEFPKNSTVGLFEDDDMRLVKKKLGNHMAIAGGMPIALLQNGTKEKCIDYAKKLIDDLAPGGGYIFTTDKIMLTASDGKAENVAAVNEFVHEYGRYQ